VVNVIFLHRGAGVERIVDRVVRSLLRGHKRRKVALIMTEFSSDAEKSVKTFVVGGKADVGGWFYKSVVVSGSLRQLAHQIVTFAVASALIG
jgi:hypothetical protein